jgi:hypothetical protein
VIGKDRIYNQVKILKLKVIILEKRIKMNNKEIFIGIDVSKETLDISIAGKHYKIAKLSKES